MWFIRSPWDYTGLILCVNGRVGINEANPKSKLDVQGEICCDKIRIANKFVVNGNYGDKWLRVFDVDHSTSTSTTASTADYGDLGFAAGKLWCTSASLTGSDVRLKAVETIRPINGAIDQVMRLNPVQFRYKTQPVDSLPKLGFIAQEVEEILPEAVGLGPDGMKGIQEGCLIALLAQALKEQQSQIDVLRAELAGAR